MAASSVRSSAPPVADNVVSFDEFENELQITSQQSEIPRIVIEGGDDVAMFRRWFFDLLDRMEFVQAANLGVGSGCTAVGEAVDQLLASGVPAFGLTDRDRLFREANWPMLFAVDDAAFAAGTEEEHLAVNSLWEIEAYLLDPALIPGWVRGDHRHAPASDADCNAAVASAADECEALLRAQPWLATAHVCGEGIADGKYCGDAVHVFAARWADELRNLEDPDGTAAAVDQHVADVLQNAPASPPDRLRWLLRYVDTKRLMMRLSHRLSLVAARHKWVLVELMAAHGLRPRELQERLVAVSLRLNP